MENPEEVLQALDEFQKMRPSEIPRELEEYLCWVAKTGDPVYQWSLIKPLFREKLTRVMTDFYESCPTLELAPCPNVEQFNYDIMKCNLLELLESFANAPFTVQRICELLTSPRKEYNRVDKFMRAIEKNILVVSTREPGPAARRSENGDGMVNGSIDEDAPSSQPSHEVEMESWVKNFTADAGVAVPADETGVPLLDSVITASKVAKIVPTGEEESLPVIGEKAEQTVGRTDVNNSNLTSNVSSDLSDTCNVNVTQQAQDSMISEGRIDNLSNNGAESVTMVSEVPEAVMNEDTSSQPSLDAEADDAETPNCRKLQTTFRTKDFGKTDVKAQKLYADEAKEDSEKSRVSQSENEQSSVASEDTTEKTIVETTKISFDCQESVIPIVENLLEKRPRVESSTSDPETGSSGRSTDDDGTSPAKKSCIVADVIERKNDNAAAFLASIDVKTAQQEATTKMDDDTKEERLSSDKIGNDEVECKENLADVTEDSEAERSGETSESKPIIEEPSFEESIDESTRKSPSRVVQQSDNCITIEEAMDEDTRINKSIVPDPIPIIEEPKEAEQTSRDSTSGTTTIEELPSDESSSTISQVVAPIEIVTEPTTIVQESPIVEGAMCSDEIVQQDITDVRNSPTSTEEKIIEPAAESMEIDGEESMSVFQQDEPMEEEPGDFVKS